MRKIMFDSYKSLMKGGEQMKRILVLAAILTLVMAGAAFAGVSGTLHDLSGGTGQICVACHTPHGAQSSSNGPLWNRNYDNSATTYTTYTNTGTFDMGPVVGLGPQSLACLSCHDGTASQLVNYPGPGAANSNYDLTSTSFNNQNNNSLINTDLTDDHPVGFVYNPGADAQVNNFPTAVNGVIANVFPLYGASNNTFECATCHDVHNIAHPARDPVYFLRTSNNQSALCGACHTAKL